MRLMTVDTARYTVKRYMIQPDTDYVGTKKAWQPIGYVIGQLTHATDQFSVEMYGDKCTSMYRLICVKGADIKLDDRVVLTGEEYTVVSIMMSSTHITATLQKAVT